MRKIPRIFQYGAKDRSLRAATVPLDMHDTGFRALARHSHGPELPENPARRCGRAHHSRRARPNRVHHLPQTTLTWTVGVAASAPELDLPTLAVNQTLEGIAAARAAGYVVELKGILWHQGENNSVDVHGRIQREAGSADCLLSGNVGGPNVALCGRPHVTGRNCGHAGAEQRRQKPPGNSGTCALHRIRLRPGPGVCT